ncbi:MAG TPA: diphosphate--fructose-6-phosphate 1-phosphotransferase [Polyangiaceae bacterium]|nr:diphosphate--fructose-6-phosphate 1-phosphotransferase [Polyangiaceae bacterium]
MSDNDKLAILVGGGPAPGINSVIGAATIRACLSGIQVVGILDGFSCIMKGDTSQTRALDIEAVSRVHFRGGSVLRTSRANPTKDPKTIAASLDSLKKLGVSKLITIGGDDTAFSALTLAEQSKGALRVVHVPKTIDNDLDLPDSIPTFGYQTARHVGTGIVQDLLTDAQTTSRWYFVVAMGRKAGHLGLGIGKAAGATLTIIPEEFGRKVIPLDEMADILVGAIVKRLAHGRQDGVAVLAEGLVEHLSHDELKQVAGDVELDEHGHIRMAEVEFGPIIKNRVQAKLKALGIKATLVSKNIGYELRCTDPIPFDMEYTRDLGYCAAKYLIEGGSGAMVTVQQGKFKPIKFSDMLDPETGKTRVRMVDVDTESYKIARRYMIRLRKDDFEDEKQLERLAKTSKLAPAEFRKRFSYLVEREAPPLAFNYP